MLCVPSITNVIRFRALSPRWVDLAQCRSLHPTKRIVNTFSCLIVQTSFTTSKDLQNLVYAQETTIALHGRQSPLCLS